MLFVLISCLFVEVNADNSPIVIATASAGVGMLVIGLIVGLVIGIVCMRRRRQSAKKGILSTKVVSLFLLCHRKSHRQLI